VIGSVSFKAGALNFALAETALDATIIAEIDSDYCVENTWLRDLVSQFSQPEIAISSPTRLL
jgi:cellulose synthase/poly-beta-1,6-N-acetylglucosamine synthase-like glycosyltransferase